MKYAPKVGLTVSAHGRAVFAIADTADAHYKRATRTKSVPCPSCPAEVGEPCVGAPATVKNSHATRKRMATRLDNQIREDEGRLAPKPRLKQQRPSWTTDDDQLVLSDASLDDIAAELGRTVPQVRERREQLEARR